MSRVVNPDQANILVVDDVPANLLAMEVVLGPLREKVVRAASGPEAIRIASELDLAVILMDVQMPQMDGFEAAEQIRKIPRAQHVPIIFVTAGFADESYLKRAYTGGAVDFLFKPFPPEVLRSKVAVFVNLYRKVYELQRAEEQVRHFNEELEERVAERTRKLEASEKRWRLLSEAGEMLSSSLDYQTTLNQVARLTVPDFADWCVVDGLSESGEIERLAQAHASRETERAEEELSRRFPGVTALPMGTGWVVATGKPELVHQVEEGRLKSVARNGEHLDLLRQLQLHSWICVPLVVRERTFGALSFSSTRPSRLYGEGDLNFAREIARRAAVAIDNARLYRAAQNEIAERRSAEERIVRINAELARARDQAIEASSSKSIFLANMSHELRTPLNAVIGYAEMLREELQQAGAPHLLEDLDKINSAARHLLAVISSILDLSKIEAGKMELQLEVCRVEDVIEEALISAQPMAEQQGNQLTLCAESEIGDCLTDPTRLRQILINLLGNASKFTENGRITVTARSENEGASEWMVLQVQDTGIGIPPEHLPHLFRKFQQVDSSPTRKYGGTGLGLAITKLLCQMLGGDVSAESQEGVGTTFTVRLPVTRTPATAGPAP